MFFVVQVFNLGILKGEIIMKSSQNPLEDNQALALWYFVKECNFKCTYCKIGRANADRSIARRIRKTIKKRFKALTNLPGDPLKESSKIIKLLKNEKVGALHYVYIYIYVMQ